MSLGKEHILPPEILFRIIDFIRADHAINMPFRLREYDFEPIADAWREWQDIHRNYDLLNFAQTCRHFRQIVLPILWKEIKLCRIYMVEFIDAFIKKLQHSNIIHPCLFGLVQTITFSEHRISPYQFWWERRKEIMMSEFFRRADRIDFHDEYTNQINKHQSAQVPCISNFEHLQALLLRILQATKARNFNIHHDVHLADFEHSRLMKFSNMGIDVLYKL